MQPLDGIRILDLTHVIAGPYATHIMRCLGAEVIKVERPKSGDSVRSLAACPELEGITPEFSAINSGKKSIEIDLKSEEGRKTILKLAKTCDVFVENFRPGVAKRLGFAAEDIRKVRPDVIYCSISGWGQIGPFANTPAYDHVIQAVTGMMRMQGEGHADAGPIKVGFPVIDVAAGMSAATALLAAVVRRARGDTSPIELDVSMVDASMMLMMTIVAKTRASGSSPQLVGNKGFIQSPGSNTYPTMDGHICLGANTLSQFKKLCTYVGRPELAAPPYLPEGLTDDSFLTNLATDELFESLSDALKNFSATQIEADLKELGVPATKVRDLNTFLTELYPLTGGVDLPGAEFLGVGFRWLGEEQPDIGPAPKLGADTEAVLRDCHKA